MGQRQLGQASLAEALLPARVGSNRRLERIAGLIDWAPMERLLAPLRASTGPPGYPPLALLTALRALPEGSGAAVGAVVNLDSVGICLRGRGRVSFGVVMAGAVLTAEDRA